MSNPDLQPTIVTQAAAPSSETVDGQSVTERPLTELIEADKYLRGQTALSKPRLGMTVRKMVRGDALGNQG